MKIMKTIVVAVLILCFCFSDQARADWPETYVKYTCSQDAGVFDLVAIYAYDLKPAEQQYDYLTRKDGLLYQIVEIPQERRWDTKPYPRAQPVVISCELNDVKYRVKLVTLSSVYGDIQTKLTLYLDEELMNPVLKDILFTGINPLENDLKEFQRLTIKENGNVSLQRLQESEVTRAWSQEEKAKLKGRGRVLYESCKNEPVGYYCTEALSNAYVAFAMLGMHYPSFRTDECKDAHNEEMAKFHWFPILVSKQPLEEIGKQFVAYTDKHIDSLENANQEPVDYEGLFIEALYEFYLTTLNDESKAELVTQIQEERLKKHKTGRFLYKYCLEETAKRKEDGICNATLTGILLGIEMFGYHIPTYAPDEACAAVKNGVSNDYASRYHSYRCQSRPDNAVYIRHLMDYLENAKLSTVMSFATDPSYMGMLHNVRSYCDGQKSKTKASHAAP